MKTKNDPGMPLFSENDVNSSENENQKVAIDPQWYVLSSRYALLHCIAGFSVLPSELIEDFADPFSRQFGGSLLCFRGQLPSSLTTKVTDGDLARFPVAFKLSDSIFKNITTLKVGNENVEFGLINGPIPFRFVNAIVFESQEQIEDVKARAFDDLNFDVQTFESKPNLFNGEESEFDFSSAEKISHSLDAGFWSRSDKICGGLATTLQALPHQEQFVRGFANLLNADVFTHCVSTADNLANSFCEMLKPNYYSDCERDLLIASIRVFCSRDPRSGLVPTKMLDEIKKQLEKSDLMSPDLSRWHGKCLEILKENADVHALTDERNVVQRGVLLALLRESPEDIIDSEGAFFRPGPVVRSISVFLSGLLCGFRGLSSRFKKPPNVANHLASLYSAAGNPHAVAPDEGIAIRVENRPAGQLENHVCLLVEDEVIVDLVTKLNPEIRMFHALGEHVGLNFKLLDARTIYCSFEFKEGDSQDVYIRFIFDSWNNSRIARFFSPCASLVKVLDKVPASEHQAKLKKSKNKIVSREKMISMLFQQSREDFNCRYAIDEELKSLVVIADQLIETIDQAEFKSHVEHVASAAKDFEV